MKLGIFLKYHRGTTCKVAIAKGSYDKIVEKIVIPTTDPAETITKVVDWLAARKITSLGVAAFGPLCLNLKDKHYGFVTSTPKLQWQFFDLRGELMRQLKVKTGKHINVHIDTDVNVCANLEFKLMKNPYAS